LILFGGSGDQLAAKVGYSSPYTHTHIHTYAHSFILASLFRQHTATLRPSQQGPSTAYPSGLQPVASNDLNGSNNRQIHRRVSRTDLDFEQALKAEGTFVLREGLDVNTLGVDNSPNRSFTSNNSTTVTPVNRAISRVVLQPQTPTVVPPTPSPVPAVSSSSAGQSKLSVNSPSVGSGPSPSSSSYDLGADVEEAERQTNRRSMYRSPGTSSSPDLATLLRKAKERGGAFVNGGTGSANSAAVAAAMKRDKRRGESPPPPLPQQQQQQTSSSSHAYSSATLVASPSSTRQEDLSPEWILTSPHRYKDYGTIKVCDFLFKKKCFQKIFNLYHPQAQKSSVRAKTSALWGKMMGTSSNRERSVAFFLFRFQNALEIASKYFILFGL